MKYHFPAALAAILITASVHADDEKSLVAAGAEVKKLAGDMKFTEGPAWVPAEKKLIFSDIPNSKLMQWSEQEGLSVFRDSEQANGNILDLEGRIISCQHAARNIIRIDAKGNVEVVADKLDGKRFNSPNDVAVRSDGTLWFTDPPWGLMDAKKQSELPGNWVYKLDPKTGNVEPVIKNLAMPNGIVFSPDETRLYVADTGFATHGDPELRTLPGRVTCYQVSKEGVLGNKLFHIDGGSDGMAVDVRGNIYTTHGKQVHIYDADGKKREAIDVPEGPANVTFGGDEFKTLFITARTSLYSIRMQIAGAKPKGANW